MPCRKGCGLECLSSAASSRKAAVQRRSNFFRMDPSLDVSLDRSSSEPLSAQIAGNLRVAIRDGRLAPGARLPSWRDLAARLGVGRGTVRSAYERLIDERLVVTAGAAGTRVATQPAPAVSAAAPLPATPYSQPRYVTCLDLGPWGAVLTQGWQREVQLTGAEAKTLKRQINQQWIYPPLAHRGTAFEMAEPGYHPAAE